MPNNYNSTYTGQHNDAYEARIAALESKVAALEAGPDKIYVGCSVLLGEFITTTSAAVGKTGLLGNSSYAIMSGLFTNKPTPPGYVRAYQLTATVSTSSSNHVILYIGQYATNETGTWSGTLYETTVTTQIFKESDVTLENGMIYNYNNHTGVYVSYSTTGAGEIRLRGITIHGWFIKP